MWCEVSLWNPLPHQVKESNAAGRLKNGLYNFMANNTFVSMAVAYSRSSSCGAHNAH